MLRGCQREMIVLQTRDSALFESAWFVLRQEKPCAGEVDMLAEAERIVSEGARPDRRRRRLGGSMGAFLLGLFCGGAFFAIIWLLLRL
ncbi:MAG: hypothetical protein E7644_01505 [Ruminococcaceae bacterium]|nr:hypothetical protein [Oscillospiraceae bacterium]